MKFLTASFSIFLALIGNYVVAGDLREKLDLPALIESFRTAGKSSNLEGYYSCVFIDLDAQKNLKFKLKIFPSVKNTTIKLWSTDIRINASDYRMEFPGGINLQYEAKEAQFEGIFMFIAGDALEMKGRQRAYNANYKYLNDGSIIAELRDMWGLKGEHGFSQIDNNSALGGFLKCNPMNERDFEESSCVIF